MIASDPFYKWLFPAMVGLVVLLVFDRQIIKSLVWRCVVAFVIALGISPVPVIGCPGMSVEPAWTVLFSTTDLVSLFVSLLFVAPYVVISLLGVTGAGVVVLELRSRAALGSRSASNNISA